MPPVIAAAGAGLAAIGGAAAAGAATGLFLGITTVGWAAISVGISIGATLLTPKPKAPRNSEQNIDRLRASIDPRTPRKTAVGLTALATDIRDEEFSADQAYFHRFIVCASHACESVDELWFDDKIAWTLASGVQGEFLNYLTVSVTPLGNGWEDIGPRMGNSRRYTGLAHIHLKYKLSGNDKKVDSPFAQSVTTRITIRGKGARFYDPRFDSTVPGGSGTHRTDDQDTWTWDDDACRNPALALLFYLLGWRINGLLAVGKGIPQERIDLESFAVAANICDETVALDGGGSEPRYRCDGVWSEGDSPETVMDMLKACMNGDLDDVDGKLRLTIIRDDIAEVVADFTADDILGDFDWQPFPPLNESFNVVRGIYTDPSDTSLYQPVDYPQVEEESPDGIDRVHTLNLPMVESVTQARRLAALRLGRQKFPGSFKAEFQATAWRVQKNSIVRLTFPPRGWIDKLFRVAEMDLRVDGVVPMVLIEEDSDLYVEPPAALAIVPVGSTPWDPFKDPIIDQLLNVNDEGIDAYLSPEVAFVPADKTGLVTSYANASGTFVIKATDGTDISANFTLSTPSGGNPNGLTAGYVGRAYSVTGGITGLVGVEDQTVLIIQATGTGPFAGVILQRRFTVIKDYGTVTVPFVANANDQNGLTPDRPTGLASLTASLPNAAGNVSIVGTFGFVHNPSPDHKNNIDGFEILTWTADNNAPHTMGTDEREKRRFVITDLNNSSHTLNFLDDVAANKWYTVGVVAVRQVGFNVHPTGYIRSLIRQVGPFQPSAVQNNTGQIGGVLASVLASTATNFNADNDGNGLTPPAATGVTVTSTTYPDSTARVKIAFTYTNSTTAGAANNIDGLLAGFRDSASSSGYTYNPADDDLIRWIPIQADRREVFMNGLPATYYFTGIIIPYRVVRSDIAASGLIVGPAAQSSSSTPHRPSATSNFTASIDGETAANIKSWSTRAGVAITAGNNIATGKVLTGSILTDAINQADWAPQSATLTLGTSDSFDSTYLTVDSTGSHLRCQFVLDYQVSVNNPTEAGEYSFTAKIWAERVSNGADTYSDTLTVTEVWTPPNASGTKKFARAVVAFEFPFESLAGSVASPVAYNIGYLIETDANTSVVCRAYRYIRASDERASQ